jgi:hypothetical protein
VHHQLTHIVTDSGERIDRSSPAEGMRRYLEWRTSQARN